MRIKLNFEDFLKRTGKTYQSIDSRAVLVRIDNSWAVALLVLRFSPEGIGVIEAKYEELEQKWNKMLSTAHFRIALDAIDFDKLSSLRDNLKAGKYRSPKLGLVAELRHSLDLFSLEGEFSSHHEYFLKKEAEWPRFSKPEGKHLEELYKSEEIQNELRDAGAPFRNPPAAYVLIREILEVRDYQPGLGFNVLVYAPFLAKIQRDVRYDNAICTIEVKFHQAFDNELRLLGYLEDRQGDRQIKGKFGPLSPRSQEIKDLSPYLKQWESAIKLEGLTSNDYLNVSLRHCTPENLVIDELDEAGSNLVKPIRPVTAINPLVAALQRFVGADLKSYLEFKQKNNRPQDNFELKVCRLLGLCGFSVARLGGTGFDILKDKSEPEVERGKCNILAYSEKRNCLLLVECTKNLPQDRDTRSLLDARATLQKEVFQSTNVELQPVLFMETVTQDKDLKGGRIIDKEDIEDLVNCLSSGESPEQLFFKFFVSPSNIVSSLDLNLTPP